MEISSRPQVTISLPAYPVVAQPHGRVSRVVVAPRGADPVHALIGAPEDPQGLTLHFVGFNTAMGPWEAARCALWASLTRTVVVMCELPGFTTFGRQLPSRVRRDLLDQDPTSWACSTLSCLLAAIDEAGVSPTGRVDVLGYSTGCSLAVAALPAIRATYHVDRLILVEPVSITSRTLPRLTMHNGADLLRAVKTVPRNYPSSWVRQAVVRELKDPKVHFSPADFLGLITMLACDDTRARMESLDLPETHLVRGCQSSLCPEEPFQDLDALLTTRGVEGTTCQVTGLGHQWWHALAAVDAYARVLAECVARDS
ncbi:MAG: alpha/beta fold hydrolase [Propionibacteriaceae bacterium]|nr:alpha/beta fold hydrolase [Propionibacteriaceae bacterium]